MTSEYAANQKAARHSDFVRMVSGSLESTSQATFISHSLAREESASRHWKIADHAAHTDEP
jgi:hypothetical protein